MPKPLRDEAKLANVRDTLERVERRQQSQSALAEGVKAMQQAVADGKPIASYAAHMKLLKEHPELADETGLADALKNTAEAEQAAIKFVKESKAAETADRPTPWVAALAVATRRATGTVPGRAASFVFASTAPYTGWRLPPAACYGGDMLVSAPPAGRFSSTAM